MKKFTFVLVMLLAYAGFTMAQVIENFEPIPMTIFSQGSTGVLSVVPNPDSSVANPSIACGKMVRAKDGDAWQGWASNVPVAIDANVNKYVHVKIWKTRISPIVFKYEKLNGMGSNSGDVHPMAAQTLTNQWEEFVFNMGAVTTVSGMQYRIVLIPDFPSEVGLTEDINIYYDDIYVNNDPAVGSDPVQKIENFEYIKLNMLMGGVDDKSSMEIATNPDKSTGNTSSNVIKFNRDKDGQIWGGFWSPTSIDLTYNKFVHVKVWKSRISPVAFHLEGGAGGTVEPLSKYPQTKVNEWEDMVWDFRTKTGVYTVIGLQPDKIDPVNLPADLTIYFDDIIVNNDSTPIGPVIQVLNVDMSAAGLLPGDSVFLAGDFGGAYGVWAEPGTIMSNQMDSIGNGIYSITILVPNGNYEFKFFKGSKWAGGDPVNKGTNRKLAVNGSFNVTYSWGVPAANLTLNVDMHGSGIAPGTPVYVAGDFGGDYGSWDKPGTNMYNMLTDMDGDSIYTTVLHLGQIGDFAFKFFNGAGWDGGEWIGNPNRVITVEGDTIANYIWGQNGMVNTRVNPLAGKIQMYPNPVRDQLTINTTIDISRVIITNTLGKIVGNALYSNNQTINTSNLSRGMYFVTFVGRDGNKVTQKLIKN